jgi:hypothetical protein
MKTRTLLLAGVAVLLMATSAHAQANGTLTLACRGVMESTMTITHDDGTASNDTTKEQVSMGIIANFAAQTVEGFGTERPLKITAVKQTTKFDGLGTIDRVPWRGPWAVHLAFSPAFVAGQV